MPTKVTIELNHERIQELLLSAPIAAECAKVADAIAARAGDGFEVEELTAQFPSPRARYRVVTATYGAKLAEAEDGALSKAVR